MSAPTWPGWGADENLLPGSFENDGGRYQMIWRPASSMSRAEAIRTILGAVELADEATVEEALMVVGVTPVELFFHASRPTPAL